MKDTRKLAVSERTEGMVGASALNYQESEIFIAIQNSQALEYDRIDAVNSDLSLQLSPYTATWGLVYWEASIGLVPQPLGAYEKRRPPVLARLANEENFGAELVHRLATNYGEEIRIEIDTAKSNVTVIFQRGVPAFLEAFIAALENIIHAHLGRTYKFEYHINAGIELETAYEKNVYNLPRAGTTVMCGTLPSVTVGGRLYQEDLIADTAAHHQKQGYQSVGNVATGPKPFVAIDGHVYLYAVGVVATDKKTEQAYALSGKTDSGTVPRTAIVGR